MIIYKKDFRGVRRNDLAERKKCLRKQRGLYEQAPTVFSDLIEKLRAIQLTVSVRTNEKCYSCVVAEYDGIIVLNGSLAPRPRCGLQELYVSLPNDEEQHHRLPPGLRSNLMNVVETALVYAGANYRHDLEVPREDYFPSSGT